MKKKKILGTGIISLSRNHLLQTPISPTPIPNSVFFFYFCHTDRDRYEQPLSVALLPRVIFIFVRHFVFSYINFQPIMLEN